MSQISVLKILLWIFIKQISFQALQNIQKQPFCNVTYTSSKDRANFSNVQEIIFRRPYLFLCSLWKSKAISV